MKKYTIMLMIQSALILSALATGNAAAAQSKKDSSLIEDCQAGKKDFLRTDDLMKNLFDNAYAYAMFPNIGKGAVGVGGAAGNGIVYENGKIIGKANMKQITVGFQFGGQAYREVIFFEDKETLNRFKKNNIEFSAEASAVAATVGASAKAKYAKGVMIFTQEKSGLMYEASVGGQKFKFTAF
jgi:lipid-binding SYLF domain-containing protein